MCCKSKFVITEDDKSHILKLYGLLNEQETEGETSATKTFAQKTKLPAGFWSVTKIKPSLDSFFTELSTFLSSNSGKTYITTVTLVGSESKIPNTDNESSNREPLEPKDLSRLRLQSIKKIIKDTFKKYREDGTLINDPSFEEKTLDGETMWVGQTFGTYKCEEGEERGKCKTEFEKCKNNTCKEIAKKYQDEQYVEVTVNFFEVPSEVRCLFNAKITIWSDGRGEQPREHVCNHAKYAVYLNEFALLNDNPNIPSFRGNSTVGKKYATMDNYGGPHDMNVSDRGGRRENTFTITPTLATRIISSSPNPRQIQLSLMCLKGTDGTYDGTKDCHDDVVHYKYEPGSDTGGQSVIGTAANISRDNVKVSVATIQVCGGNQ
jgi:hypothetical protein